MIINKIKSFALVLAALVLMAGMAVGLGTVKTNTAQAETEDIIDYFKIAVLSDTHYFPALYMGNNAAYNKSTAGITLTTESGAILDKALELIAIDNPDLLLITGDLTKNGERDGHEEVAEKLSAFKQATGTEVYVINGNHDVNNSSATDYSSGKAVAAAVTTPARFKQVYADFGYNQAISKFTPAAGKTAGGLSYAVRPKNGYTLLAIDTCKYSSDSTSSKANENENGGALSAELLAWISEQSAAAMEREDTIIAFQHHGIVPHFNAQPTLFGSYLVDEYEHVANEYADMGIKFAFTGHMHANDIAEFESENGNMIYDIETGSLVSYPSSYRFCSFSRGVNDISEFVTRLNVETKNITALEYVNPVTNQNVKITDLDKHIKNNTALNTDIVYSLAMSIINPYVDSFVASGGVTNIISESVGEYDVTGMLETLILRVLPTDKNNALALAEIGTVYYNMTRMRIILNVSYSGFAIEFYIELNDIVKMFTDTIAKFEADYITDFSYLSGQIYKMISGVMDYAFEDGKTVEEFVNAVYFGHLFGDEQDNDDIDWLTAILDMLGGDNYEGINAILEEVVVPILKETLDNMLSNITFDVFSLLKSTNSLAGLAIAAIKAMYPGLGNLGGILELTPYGTDSLVDLILSDTVMELAGTVIYPLISSLVYDTNYEQDNKTAITVINKIYTMRTVTFMANGGVFKTVKVVQGGSLTDIPAVPAKEGHTGAWDITDFSLITSNITVNALYTANTMTITFKAEGHADIIKTVSYGGTLAEADIPTIPEREGYTAVWSVTDFTNIKTDITVNAAYTANTMTITFKAEGHADIIKTVSYGGTLAEADIPTIPEREGYTAVWSVTDFSNITENLTVSAMYTQIPEEAPPEEGGCACGAIDLTGGTFLLIGLVTLAGVGLLMIRRRKQKRL